jgi:hypothetical protein
MKKGVTVDGVRYKAMDVRLDQVRGDIVINANHNYMQ